MNRKTILFACVLSIMALALAHTPAETNAIVRLMLRNSLFSLNDNMEANADRGVRESTSTWNGFLMRGEIDGWTQQERKEAFAWYLSTIATNDCVSLGTMDEEYMRVAIKQCGVLDFSEAVPYLKVLIGNPRGLYRERAIEIVVKLCPVDDSMTNYAETIMTNAIGYTLRERGTVSCRYASRLMSFAATNEVQEAIQDRAVNMFYRNRMLPSNAYPVVDSVLVKYISGYATSSNRLEYALNALSLPNNGPVARRRFTSVTNQLLSSGQPLVQLNIGEGGD